MAKTFIGIVGTAIGSMAMKLMTAAFVEDLILWGLGKLVDATESKADNELYEKVKKQLRG